MWKQGLDKQQFNREQHQESRNHQFEMMSHPGAHQCQGGMSWHGTEHGMCHLPRKYWRSRSPRSERELWSLQLLTRLGRVVGWGQVRWWPVEEEELELEEGWHEQELAPVTAQAEAFWAALPEWKVWPLELTPLCWWLCRSNIENC